MPTRTKLVFAFSVVIAFGLGIATAFFIAPASSGVHVSPSPGRKADVPKEKVPKTPTNLETASFSSWVINYSAVGPLRLKMSIPDAAKQLGIADWHAAWFPENARIECGYFPLAGSGAANQIAIGIGNILPGNPDGTVGYISIGGGQNDRSLDSELPRTADGIGLGSTKAEVTAAYGNALTIGQGNGETPSTVMSLDAPVSQSIQFIVGDSSGTVDEIEIFSNSPGINDGGCGD